MQQERSRMLGEMPMNKLVPKVSIPIMISMLIQALYNVVDSIFVAKFDPNALTAVSLANPMQMLMISLAIGMAVGVNSLISRRLGQRQAAAARQAAWNGFVIQLCSILLFVLIGLFYARHFIASFSENPVIQDLGEKYLRICCCGSMGIFMSMLIERMLQSTGGTIFSMVTQLCGAVTNLILDPILIFGYLGAPRMGIEGAALATVIGQWCSMIVGFVLNQRHNHELKIKIEDFRIRGSVLKDIFSVGLPGTIMSAIGSVMIVAMNKLLISYGDEAVSVMGVYFKLQSFVFMPVFGLSNGLVPILGYNYGAENKARIYEAIKVSLKIALGIMLLGMLAFQLLPVQLMSLFEAGEAGTLTEIGVIALRTISLHFLLAAVVITLSTTFQAIGHGVYSMIISICRQLLVLIPAAWLLSRLGGRDAIWYAFIIAEVVALIICLVFFRMCDRKYIRPMGTEKEGKTA